MKSILTIFLTFSVIAGNAQTTTKTEDLNWTPDLSVTHAIATLTLPKNDTIEVYFLKIPEIIEFELQPIAAKWFLGYRYLDYHDHFYYAKYLYLDKKPVKEQVLMSIPKQ